MNCCYILYSEKLKRNYIGICHDDLNARIEKHNSHEYGNHRYTAKADDWQLILTVDCETYAQAMRIEKRCLILKKLSTFGLEFHAMARWRNK